jgi:hypothetical protein
MDLAADLLESSNPTEIRQSDHKGALDHVGAGLANQFDSGFGRPPGCEQIIDEKDPSPGLDRVHMHLDAVAPVLEIEISSDRFSRQLPGFADRNESKAQLIGDRRPEDESTGLNADYDIDSRILMTARDAIDRESESLRLVKQCRDVAKLNTRLGVVGDGADEGFQGRQRETPICQSTRYPNDSTTEGL